MDRVLRSLALYMHTKHAPIARAVRAQAVFVAFPLLPASFTAKGKNKTVKCFGVWHIYLNVAGKSAMRKSIVHANTTTP